MLEMLAAHGSPVQSELGLQQFGVTREIERDFDPQFGVTVSFHGQILSRDEGLQMLHTCHA
jgi:hypothetical protein